MVRKQPSAEELALWRQVASSVDPLRHKSRQQTRSEQTRSEQTRSESSNLPSKPSAAKAAPRGAPARTAPPSAPPAPTPLGEGQSAGIDRRQWDRFRKGKLPIDGKLDLHGHTQRQAHDELLGFLRASRAKGRRCVLVITGKGMTGGKDGVLRQSVPRWLNETQFRPLVLAYDQARMKHGGEGAIYILLKRVK